MSLVLRISSAPWFAGAAFTQWSVPVTKAAVDYVALSRICGNRSQSVQTPDTAPKKQKK